MFLMGSFKLDSNKQFTFINGLYPLMVITYCFFIRNIYYRSCIVFWKEMTKRSKKIALVLGMILNVWPLICFLFLLITIG